MLGVLNNKKVKLFLKIKIKYTLQIYVNETIFIVKILIEFYI